MYLNSPLNIAQGYRHTEGSPDFIRHNEKWQETPKFIPPRLNKNQINSKLEIFFKLDFYALVLVVFCFFDI